MLLPILLGQGTAGPQNYTLSVDPASFALTYSPVTPQAARQLDVAATSYSYTHANPVLLATRQLPITATSYAWTPPAPTLARTYVLPIDAAALAISPANPTLVAARQWSAEAASYAYTTAAPTLLADRVLAIGGDALDISFTPVTLDYTQNAKELPIDATSWAVTFAGPALTVTRALGVEAASASLSFAAPVAELARQLSVAPGAYDILAAPVTLAAARRLAVYPAYTTYVEAGYVQDGYVGRSTTYSLDTAYVTSGYVRPGYVAPGISAGITAQRVLKPNAASIAIAFAPPTLVRERASYPVNLTRASLLYRLWQLHGLDAAAPLSVSASARTAGSLAQTISGTATVTVSTTTAPDFNGDALDTIIDELAAIYGLTGDLVVTSTSRSAGGVVQALANSGGVTTVTRQ